MASKQAGRQYSPHQTWSQHPLSPKLNIKKPSATPYQAKMFRGPPLHFFLNFSDSPKKGEGVTGHVSLILEAKFGTFFTLLATCITFALLS